MSESCEWVYDKVDEVWCTECGYDFALIEEAPEIDNNKCCPYCGREIFIKDDLNG